MRSAQRHDRSSASEGRAFAAPGSARIRRKPSRPRATPFYNGSFSGDAPGGAGGLAPRERRDAEFSEASRSDGRDQRPPQW